MTKGAARLSPGRPTANASLTRPLTDISSPPRHIDDELLTRVGDTYELTPPAGRELTALLTDRAPGIRLRFQAGTPDLVNHRTNRLSEVDGVILPQGLLANAPAIELCEDAWTCVAFAHSLAVGPRRPRNCPPAPGWRRFPVAGLLPDPPAARPRHRTPRRDRRGELPLRPHLIAGTDRLAALPGHAPRPAS